MISFSQTLHTYGKIIRPLALSMKIDARHKQLEKELIQSAYKYVRDRKTLFTLMDQVINHIFP